MSTIKERARELASKHKLPITNDWGYALSVLAALEEALQNPCKIEGHWVHAFKDEAEFLEYLKMQREWDKRGLADDEIREHIIAFGDFHNSLKQIDPPYSFETIIGKYIAERKKREL